MPHVAYMADMIVLLLTSIKCTEVHFYTFFRASPLSPLFLFNSKKNSSIQGYHSILHAGDQMPSQLGNSFYSLVCA